MPFWQALLIFLGFTALVSLPVGVLIGLIIREGRREPLPLIEVEDDQDFQHYLDDRERRRRRAQFKQADRYRKGLT